nr:immunoglobulin heavy chain junction region [Mus musculus]
CAIISVVSKAWYLDVW